jgi:general secretion pathway protein F
MPIYLYEALHADGKECQGRIEAINERNARSQLRTEGLLPLVVQALPHTVQENNDASLRWWQRPVLASRAFDLSQRAIFVRQFASLVSNHLPLTQALTILLGEAKSKAQKNIIASIRADVSAGSSLGASLGQFGDEFADVDRAVIAAGEQGGCLDKVLDLLASDLENQHSLRGKLLAATTYPAIVACVALGIIVFLVTFVVPQVATVFKGSQHELPMLTQILLGLSAILRQWWWLLLLFLCSAAMALRWALAQKAFRYKWDAAFLSLPIVGHLVRGYNCARYASTLAMLTAAGVPILKALQACTETLANQAMKTQAMEVVHLVREGSTLGAALSQQTYFLELLTTFVRVGEQTGALPTMVDKAAQQLTSDVQRKTMALATALDPLLVVSMGAVVMLIVLAVLIPIMDLNQLIK